MIKIEITRPFEFGGKTYTELELDEPTGGALEAYEKAKQAGENDFGAMFRMYAHDTGVSTDIFRKMRLTDLKKVMDFFVPFLKAMGDTGEPGATPSSPT